MNDLTETYWLFNDLALGCENRTSHYKKEQKLFHTVMGDIALRIRRDDCTDDGCDHRKT